MRDASACFLLAMELSSRGRHDLAAEKLREAIAADPDADRLYAALAVCLFELESPQEAEEAARRAIELDPNDSFNHEVHARILLGRGRIREAAAAAQRAIDIDPGRAMSWWALAAARLAQNRLREALEAAEHGLALDPDDADLRSLRNVALTRLGRPVAVDEARRALEMDPESAEAHAHFGLALLYDGKPQKAIVHFRESLRLDPMSTYARDGLLDALRTRSWFYRPIFAYRKLLGRCSVVAQPWIVLALIAALAGSRWLADNAPVTAPYMHLARGLVYAFVLFVLFGDGLINVILRFDPIGRHVLTPRQSRLALWFAIFGVPLIPVLVMKALSEGPAWERLTFILFPIVLTLAVLSDLDYARPRLAGNWLLAAAIAGAALLTIHFFIAPLGIAPDPQSLGRGIVIVAVILWTWDTFGSHDE